MSVLYAVRSRFTDPTQEQAWNEWYRGHIDVLLGVPGFLAAQRFHSEHTVDDRPYLALYEVAGPEVFRSEPYLAIWGFDQWRALIDNWTRDIFRPLDGSAPDFATPIDGAMQAAFVSGPEVAVQSALAEIESLRPSARAAAVTGLDGSCGGIAWEIVPDGGPTAPFPSAVEVQLAQAGYTPLTDCLRPATAERT